ncbi:MAG: beta-ketoacyl-[acyl-carrier-protein] synthase family protein [Bacteroidales bacterium]|nr:beta-ketoacyl-[acyl-carrier-protein] synthase family protein [Bacteroidales bacterium]
MSNITENNRRVVITGIGPVCSNGIGKDEFWNNILSQKFIVERIPEKYQSFHNYKTSFYIPFPKINLDDFSFFKKYSGIMEATSVLAIVSTELALIDSGLKEDTNSNIASEILENSGIILGNGIGSLNTGFSFYVFHTYNKLLKNTPGDFIKPKFNRMVIPATMPDSATAWISILYKINSFNYTINASCASGTYAIGEAFRKIKDSYSDIMITGGVECLKDESGAILRGFDSLGTLTKSTDGRPMPFSYDRSGFLFAEGGGCILILEELEMAKSRGAKIYAEIVDYQSNSDAHNIVQVQESGEQIAKLLKSVIGSHKIDYLNTHGTGTELNDKVEQKVIKEIFGNKENQPIVNSTKSILGHTIGASGALEIAVTALSIKNSKIHANLSDNNFDDLNLATKTVDMEINYALKTSYGFGGHNAAILLKKYRE